MEKYYIAWWNVENLFDVSDSTDRPTWLQEKLQNELDGWDNKVLDKKLTQIAKVIIKMNDEKGPDILGVCEIENKNVLDKLLIHLSCLGKNYQIAHHDMSDKRGIDIAFIYNSDKFSTKEQFSHTILKRNATRDIFQVNFTTKQGNKFIVIGNHWPSRSGGEYKSEPYRIIAGETLSYWVQRIIELKGEKTPILVMGDFNDEPFNRSLTEYALSTSSIKKVLNANTPKLLNLMWPTLGKAVGSHYYGNYPNVLDQFLISKGFLGANFNIQLDSVEIFQEPEMTNNGDYPSPIRFGRPSSKKTYNNNGYSDHFPIVLMIEEK